MKHWGIFTDSRSNTKEFISLLFDENGPQNFEFLKDKKGTLYSDAVLAKYIEEEERHGLKTLTKDTDQSLLSMSSGERKKRLLGYLLDQKLDFLILVNPFDNLDITSQAALRSRLLELATSMHIIQFVGRKDDFLRDIHMDYALLTNNKFITFPNLSALLNAILGHKSMYTEKIPAPIVSKSKLPNTLVAFKKVSVSFEGRTVLQHINWTIKKGEFWNLIGPNGSGKSTLLKMVTGDSHKGYGQDLMVFGHQKGSGESVWDLKEHIGYFTPSMTDRFKGYHTLENMLISGLHDSVGLYVKPSDVEKRLAFEWLSLLKLEKKQNQYFHELNTNEKRLLMTARAMIKHPPLLILDEPTAGLDDVSAQFFVGLVNKIAKESTSAIVFVSHRIEPGLQSDKILELTPHKNGSIGKIK